MGQVQPFRLDDDTIIYVQTDDDIDTTEITQALETDALAPPSHDPEDDLELPDPSTTPLPSDSDIDDELENDGAKSKAWKYSNRHGLSPAAGSSDQSPRSSASPTPAQRVGTLVKAYTTHVIKDIRDTALADVQIEKVALEFGIGLDTKAQIPYIASSSAKCSVKVTIECKLTPPPVAQEIDLSSDNPS